MRPDLTPSLVTDASARACLAAREAHESRLAGAATRVLRSYVREAVRSFEHAQHVVTASAVEAEPPKFSLPVSSQLIDHVAANGELEVVTAKYRERITKTTGATLAGDLSIEFAQRNRLLDGVIASQSGMKIVTASQDLVGTMMTSLQESYDSGASIPNAARAMRAAGYGHSQAMGERIARTETVSASNAASLAMVTEGTDMQVKVWMATGDERTREEHADADGQEVALTDAFDVGGEELMYPGDPDGSEENVINCRCTLGYSDQASVATIAGGTMATIDKTRKSLRARAAALADDTPAPDPAAGGTVGAGWSGIIAQEGVDTGDGRRIDPGALTWRALPLTMMGQTVTPEWGGHTDAVVCGRIDTIERAGADITASGVFDTGEDGSNIERLVRDQMLKGVSVDLAIIAAEIEEDPEIDDPMEAYFMGTMVVKEGVVLGATVVPFPAFENATIAVIAGGAMRLHNCRPGELDGKRVMLANFFFPFNAELADAAPADAPADPAMPGMGDDTPKDQALEDAMAAAEDAMASLRTCYDAAMAEDDAEETAEGETEPAPEGGTP